VGQCPDNIVEQSRDRLSFLLEVKPRLHLPPKNMSDLRRRNCLGFLMMFRRGFEGQGVRTAQSVHAGNSHARRVYDQPPWPKPYTISHRGPTPTQSATVAQALHNQSFRHPTLTGRTLHPALAPVSATTRKPDPDLPLHSKPSPIPSQTTFILPLGLPEALHRCRPEQQVHCRPWPDREPIHSAGCKKGPGLAHTSNQTKASGTTTTTEPAPAPEGRRSPGPRG
jgi:hypothetical protein